MVIVLAAALTACTDNGTGAAEGYADRGSSAGSSEAARETAATEESDAAAPRDASLDGDLPPTDPLALDELYGEQLAELGVELTDRGGLLDRTEGYEVSEDGTHLALYVAPTTDRSEQDYVDGMVAITAVFASDVFDRWPGLATFDVCQELPPDEVEDGYVPTVSQVDLSRAAAASIDWTSATLVDLYAAEITHEQTDILTFGMLHRHPELLAARSQAREATGTTGTES